MTRRHPLDAKSLLALTLLLAGAACTGSDNLLAPNHGRVRFVLGGADGGSLATSGPVAVAANDGGTVGDGAIDPMHGEGEGEGDGEPRRLIKAANVVFSSILARNLDGVLENVVMDLPDTVDVVTLENGRQIQLPEGQLPAGTYDQIVVVMTQVQVVLMNDTKITIDPPGGGWTAIAPLCPPVEVEESGESTVSLAIEVRNSFLWKNDRFHFAPRFRPPFGCASVPEPTVE